MTEVSPTPFDRLWRSFRELVDAHVGRRLTFFGAWDYVVVSTDGQTVSARVASSDVPLPDLVGAPYAPGLAGENVRLAVGGRCVVRFRNGDPTKPEVIGGDYGAAPTSIAFAGGGAAAARVGDSVDCGWIVFTSGGTFNSYYPGTTAGAIAAAAQATAISGIAVHLFGGTIASGSSIVTVGG